MIFIEPVNMNPEKAEPQNKSSQSAENDTGEINFFSLLSQFSQDSKTAKNTSSSNSDNHILQGNKAIDQKSFSMEKTHLYQEALPISLGFSNIESSSDKETSPGTTEIPTPNISPFSTAVNSETAEKAASEQPVVDNLIPITPGTSLPAKPLSSPDQTDTAQMDWSGKRQILPGTVAVQNSPKNNTLAGEVFVDQAPQKLNNSKEFPDLTEVRINEKTPIRLSNSPDQRVTFQTPSIFSGKGSVKANELTFNSSIESNKSETETKSIITTPPTHYQQEEKEEFVPSPVMWEVKDGEGLKSSPLMEELSPSSFRHPLSGEDKGKEGHFLDSEKNPALGPMQETPEVINGEQAKRALRPSISDGIGSSEGLTKEKLNKEGFQLFDGGAGEGSKGSKQLGTEFSEYFKQEEKHADSSDKSAILGKSGFFESIKFSNGQIPADSATKLQESPTPMPPAKNFEENIMKQMIDKTFLNIGEGHTEIRISLKPDALGRVYLELDLSKDHLQAKIFSENQLVKEAVENNLSLLKEALNDKGIKVERLDVFILPSSHSIVQSGQSLPHGGDERAYGFNMGMNSQQKERGRNRDQSYPKPEDQITDDSLVNFFI